MPNRLSHSAINRYETCPESYRLHYQERLRPRVKSVALLFGSAIDAGAQALALWNPAYRDIFKKAWQTQDINGTEEDLSTSPNVRYSDMSRDFDIVCSASEFVLVAQQGPEWRSLYKDVLKRKRDLHWYGLSDEDRSLYNLVGWHVMYSKGLLMLEALEHTLKENLIETLGTQVEVNLSNGTDSIVGYADLVCRWKGYDLPVVLDFKSSSIEYAEDSVRVSKQLALYVHDLSEKYDNTRLAGFVILDKHIDKNKKKVCESCGYDGTGTRFQSCNKDIDGRRCNGVWIETTNPKARVKVIVDTVGADIEDIVIGAADTTTALISAGDFTPRLESCIGPYGLCDYYNLCHKGSEDGLIRIPEKAR